MHEAKGSNIYRLAFFFVPSFVSNNSPLLHVVSFGGLVIHIQLLALPLLLLLVAAFRVTDRFFFR